MRTSLGTLVGSLTIGILAAGLATACGGGPAPTAPSPWSAAPFGTLQATRVSGGFVGRFDREASSLAGARGVTSAAAVPSAPSGLTASATGSSIFLAWTAPAGASGITGYVIEAGSTSNASDLANFFTGSPATTYTATGVPAGTYYVRVRAVSADGVGPASGQAVLVVGCSTLGAPSGLTIVANSGGAVSLAWTAASGNPTTYVMEVGSAPGASDVVISDLGSTATSMTATGVGAGTFYVRVKAADHCGRSNPSNEVRLDIASVTNPTTYDGQWRGTTSQGQAFAMTVSQNEITSIVFGVVNTACGGFVIPAFAPPIGHLAISNGAVRSTFVGNPETTLTATFGSATSVTGTLTLVFTPTSAVPCSGTLSFSWTASR